MRLTFQSLENEKAKILMHLMRVYLYLHNFTETEERATEL